MTRPPRNLAETLRVFRTVRPELQVPAEGLPWRYIACGQGEETLVILPGAMGVADLSFQLILSLENRYRILAVSYPAARSMEQMMEGVEAILDWEGVEEAHVLGGSFGGFLAQCLARRAPHKVKSLILSHTATPSRDHVGRVRLGKAVYRLIPKIALGPLFRKRLPRILPDNTPEPEFWNDFLMEIMASVPKKYLLAVTNCVLDLMANYEFSTKDLVDWPGRILIIESDNDASVPEDARESLRELYPRARVHTFHGTRHSSLIAEPERYAELVADFLAGATGTEGEPDGQTSAATNGKGFPATAEKQGAATQASG